MMIPQLRIVIFVVVLFFLILYLVVKTAVRKGIVAAYHDISEEKKHDKMIKGIMTGGDFSASEEDTNL